MKDHAFSPRPQRSRDSLLIRSFQSVCAFTLVVSTLLLGVAIPARFAQLNRLAPELDVFSGTLGPAEEDAFSQVGISLASYAGYVTALEAVTSLTGIMAGAIIFWRKRDDWMALFVSLALITLGTFPTPLMTSVAAYQPALSFLVTLLQFIGIGPSLLIFYLFPDGRFIPGWTKWIALLWMGYSVVWLFFPALKPPITIFAIQTSPFWITGFIVLVTGVGMYAQIHRYRNYATPIQRQQGKWIVFGFCVTLSLTAVIGLLATLLDFSQPAPATMLALLAAITVILLGLSLTPFTVMLSIFQYRLWDIDILIRRTLQYSVISGLLGLTYFGLVVGLQSLTSAIGGQQSEFITVLSTLAIAALFFPLRNRVQEFIDKRFYRKKYDAQKVLAEFAATCRDETDLDKLTARLEEVIDETLQPEKVSVWIKPTADSGRPTAEPARPIPPNK